MTDSGTYLEVRLSFDSENRNIVDLSRHLALNEKGEITGSKYVFTHSLELDEKLIQLLNDTITGMQSILDRAKEDA